MENRSAEILPRDASSRVLRRHFQTIVFTRKHPQVSIGCISRSLPKAIRKCETLMQCEVDSAPFESFNLKLSSVNTLETPLAASTALH